MSDNLIVAVFPSRVMLTRALDHLMKNKPVEIVHAAIVAKAETGEVVVVDDEIGADEGGVAGGTLGAAMGALGLAQLGALAIPGIGAIIALGAGALLGGFVGGITGRMAASMISFGATRDERIAALAHDLRAGSPALVLEVKDAQSVMETLKQELANFRAELIERHAIAIV